MTGREQERFADLRQKVAQAIRHYLQDDCGHKSYEGTWEMLISYPSYFDDETATAAPDFYQLTLHCYVLGPHRHYVWSGKNWGEVLDKCEVNIDPWVREEMES